MNGEGSSMPRFKHVHDQAADECDQPHSVEDGERSTIGDENGTV